MDIQMIEDGTHIAEWAHRFERALAAINARIVFLAGFVDVNLDADGEVQHILDRNKPAYRQVAAHRAWEELRGMMVLRCTLVTQALSSLGLSLTHQITSQVERDLERKGIKPGADGFDLHRQMDRMVGGIAAPAVVPAGAR